MRFSIAAIFALASAVLAQDPTDGFDAISKPTKDEKVAAGSTYNIVWAPTPRFAGPITITLLGGATPALLNTIETIAQGVDNSKGSFDWKVGSTLGDKATYGIRISWQEDAAIFQYSFPFKIVGGSVQTSSVTSTTSGALSTSISTSFVITSSIISSNLSTTASSAPSQTTVNLSTTLTGTSSRTLAAPSTIPTSGAARMGGNTIAFFGGLVAIAVLAL
ncbi:Ser-Thr-rich glycosyl-phosphatidyl-inositol-anchored membrane family-domain-containing protein [Lasiosphaeria hispida]|uniref:Ser-Thr-rich glycosyl-phosphatidyl-inositol-anchored membrane family-domain-containing protein n=1 Tax=Lasiosphaeria hispida TaxID=260671 RepID=A0AAJ0H6G9_9PEZI|nr:Ser-Thr-rich glycosyl-phosphatidyl-inositol-anchored membrane family-domain-containing protein [Lasiosphaeria hispida]